MENLQKQQKLLAEHIREQHGALERQQQAISQLTLSTQQWWQPGCFGCESRTHIRKDCPGGGHGQNQRGGSQNPEQETRIQAASVKREDSTAVSHAVEGKSGSSKPLDGNRPPIYMAGGTPMIQAKLGGVDVRCVVDSGSVVSFVTEYFYRKKLQPTCGRVKRREQMLTLRAANGLEILYMGYQELEIELDGV